MKRLSTIASVLGLLIVAACANAQTLYVKADVPFNFVVDNGSFTAGTYSVSVISREGSKTLLIRSESSKKQAIVLSNAAVSLKPSPDTHLTFHRYGDQYFLEQIWLQGETSGRALRMSRREVEVARNTQASDDVIVLASLR